MDWLGITLLLLYNVLIIINIIRSQMWNKTWVNALREQITEVSTLEAKLLFIKIQWPSVYYYIEDNDNGIVDVYAKYLNDVKVIIKHFASDDAVYNRQCAEELVEKLNEKI